MASAYFQQMLAIIAAGAGGVPLDTDVQSYLTRVASAGGSVPSDQSTALSAFVTSLKSAGAWSAIKEIWVPLGANGDLTTCAVKLKDGTASQDSVTLSNFVSGDYTVATGLDPQVGNSTKRGLTGFIPSTHGSLTASDWGVSAFTTRQIAASAGVLAGSGASTQFYLQYTGSAGQSKIGGASAFSLTPSNSLQQFKSRHLTTVQISGGIAQAYYGGYLQNSVSQASPALPTSQINLLSGNNGSLFGDAAIAGYLIHLPLTAAQLRAVQLAFWTLNTAIGRSSFVDDLVGLGDSYTFTTPSGPSSAANSWLALAAAQKGWGYTLAGWPGRGWARSGNYMAGYVGRDAFWKVAISANASKHIVFAMGLNDGNYGASAAAAESNATALMQFLADYGYPAEYIKVGTPYWSYYVADQPLTADIAQRLRSVSAAFGVGVVDFYAGGTVGTSAYATNVGDIHLNNAGHAVLAADFAAAAADWT